MNRVARKSSLAALLLPLILAGCGSSSGSGATSSPSLPPTKAITVTVKDGKVTPAPGTFAVKKGDELSITVTSDKVDEVHVHGFDKEMELTPNVTGTLVFTATMTGSFEVETHKTDKLLFTLQVQP